MRRILLAALAVTLLAGCGVPAGTDGSLVDDWAAPKKPVLVAPTAGVCHNNVTATEMYFPSQQAAYLSIPCDSPHQGETAVVGAFTGDDAQRGTAPEADTVSAQAAYLDCVAKTKAFLGDDYRTGWLQLYVRVPTTDGWAGGARWYTCDLVEISHDRQGVPRSRSGSLKGTLAADSTRRIDCSTITAGAAGSTSVTLVEAPCVGAHNGEYAGLYVAPVMPPPANDAEKQQLGSHCRPVVAAYGGVPNDGSLTRRFGFVFSWFGLAEWKRGNRGVQCTLWMKTTATKLMKGAGPSAFPVR